MVDEIEVGKKYVITTTCGCRDFAKNLGYGDVVIALGNALNDGMSTLCSREDTYEQVGLEADTKVRDLIDQDEANGDGSYEGRTWTYIAPDELSELAEEEGGN